MKFLYFTKWLWNNSKFDYKVAIACLLSSIMTMFVKELAVVTVFLFIVLMVRLLIDIAKDTWKDFNASQNSLVDTIKNSEKK